MADVISSISFASGLCTGYVPLTLTEGANISLAAGSGTLTVAVTGLTIGTDVQAYDAELAAIAGLVSAANKLPYFTGSGTAALTDLTSTARSLLDDTSTSDMRTTLGLAIGTNVQAYDATLAALAALTIAADSLTIGTGADAFSQTTFSANTFPARASSGSLVAKTITDFGLSLVDDADASTARTTLGLVIGTNVQAYDAELAALAGLTSAADKLPYFTGSGTAALADFTTAGRALVDDADASAQRTTLGLAIGTNVQAYDATLAALAALTIAANSLTIGTGADAFSQTTFDANTFPARASSGNLVAKTITDFGLSLVDDADASAGRTTLGVAIGTNVQAYDATLAALAALTIAADSLTIGTGADAFSQTTFSANTFPARASSGSLVAKAITDFGLSLVDDADASTARTTLGLVIGTNVQAYDAELAAIAGLVSAADRLPYFTGSGTASLATFTTAGRALVDDADASAQRTTLGLGTSATVDTGTSGTKVPLLDGANTWSSTNKFPNSGGVQIAANSGGYVKLRVNETLTADRTVTILTGDADRQLTIAGTASVTGTNTGDQTTVSGNAGSATILATARAIYGNNFDGSAALTQVIASTYGGTGNGFAKISGPATAEKTFTLPNADCTILTTNAAVTVTQGGTGAATLASQGVLIGNGTSAVSTTGIRGHIDGLTLSRASSTTITIAAGQATDSGNAALLLLSAAITKSTSAWAVGDGNGGKMSAAGIAADTWYHWWLIRRSDTGVVDVGFDVSATSPTMPTSYDQKRLIMSWKTNGSSQWYSGVQYGDEFLWDVAVLDVNTTVGTTATLYTLSTPGGIKCWALMRGLYGGAGYANSSQSVLITSPDESDQAATGSVFSLVGSVDGFLKTRTDTSSRIRVRASAAGQSIELLTFGFVHPRGRNL